MTLAFSQLEELKLATEFIAGRYKHKIAEEPVRYETWKRTEKIGKGTFGTVHQEICVESGGLRAVKQIERSSARMNEIAILAQLRSYPEHFVRLEGWFEDKDNIYLAMEYLPGDLDGLLKERDLSQDDIKRVTKQILAGLEILHKRNICHRDLKPSNILIARWIPLSVRIGDFGVSKYNDGNTEWRTVTGTRPFMAPELLLGFGGQESSVYTTAVDIWSLGCLVYFMITKTLPFPEDRNLINFLQGQGSFPLSSGVTIPHSAIGFLASLLQPLPEDRAPASKAQLHSWLLIKERDETIWDIPADENKAASRPELKQIAKDSAVGAERKLAPLGGPDPASTPKLKQIAKDSVIGAEHRLAPLGGPDSKAIQYVLMAAAASGDCKLLHELLEKGARPMEGTYGYTPIYAAAQNGHIQAIDLLLQYGAHLGLDGIHQSSALHGAAASGNLEAVQYLLDKGSDASLRSSGTAGWSILHTAARHCQVDLVRYLLDHRLADISEKTLDNGLEPLALAATCNHPSVVGLLLERGANLSERSKNGFMAQHWAAQYDSLESLKLLVEKGADLATRGGDDGWTTLHIAALCGHLNIVRYLLEGGSDISAKKINNGWDSLHLAASKGHLDVVRLLLEEGANATSTTTKEGMTAISMAAAVGHTDVVLLLLEFSEKGITKPSM